MLALAVEMVNAGLLEDWWDIRFGFRLGLLLRVGYEVDVFLGAVSCCVRRVLGRTVYIAVVFDLLALFFRVFFGFDLGLGFGLVGRVDIVIVGIHHLGGLFEQSVAVSKR